MCQQILVEVAMYSFMYGLFSESVIVDKGLGTVTIISVIDDLTAPSFPVLVPSLAALIAFSRSTSDSSDCNVVFKFMLEENLFLEHGVQVNMGDKLTARCFVKMNNIQLVKAGKLKVSA